MAPEEAAMSEAKKVLEEAIERWNATDREGWAALYTDDVDYEAPGGARISGLADLKVKYFDALVTAAPDRGSSDVVLIAEGDYVVELARYTGTHTGTWRTNCRLDAPGIIGQKRRRYGLKHGSNQDSSYSGFCFSD